MYKPTLADLSALAAIVAHRSFRKAADELGLAPSTLSHMLRVLEQNIGVRLLNRTTRSVSPTEAGMRLVSRLQPLLRGLDLALEEVNTFRDLPSGSLRINASETAVRALMAQVVPAFLARYPNMTLDLVSEGKLVDIVAAGFDAGIRLGEALSQDMVAVRIGGDYRFITVAAPTYVAQHGAPRLPDDLLQHRCIRIRMPSGKLYRWEFARHGEEIAIDVPGALILDHLVLMAEAAAQGLGIAYIPQAVAQPFLDRGELVTLLDDWCFSLPGIYLYYPGHRHVPQGLKALIEVIKEFNPV